MGNTSAIKSKRREKMIGVQLDLERRKQNLTRKQLASMCDMSVTTLASLLNDKPTCLLASYERVANALGKSIRSKLVKL